MAYEEYNDRQRLTKQHSDDQDHFSAYRDFIYYTSSVTPGIRLAMAVEKPDHPSYLVVSTHGWHMSIGSFTPNEDTPAECLHIYVDMRGRAFSDGEPDCNMLELMDVFDAIRYVRRHYAHYLIDPDCIYYEGGSGGGGNGYSLVSHFPDLFAAATALVGPSDYALWYDHDKVGEFRDELDVWVGGAPADHAEAYAVRSGACCVENLLTPLYIAHGTGDRRVPLEQAHRYLQAAKEAGKDSLIRYFEMEGVGGADHMDHASEAVLERLKNESEANRQDHRTPVTIPASGQFLIPGYLVTKAFSVFLDDTDTMGRIVYDLPSQTFTVEAACPYRLIPGDLARP